jgi:CRP-like cAMP-binding protein
MITLETNTVATISVQAFNSGRESTNRVLPISRHLKPGQTLFFEGDRPDYLYLLKSGWMKMVRVSSKGRNVITELVFPGEYFDLPCLLDGQPYPFSAQALAGHSAEIIAIPKSAVVHNNSLQQEAGLQSLVRLRQQRQMMTILAAEQVEQRTLSAITFMAQRLGISVQHTFSLPMLLNRQEFAELIGTTTETAIRSLSELRRRGWICERGDLVICNLNLENNSPCAA